MLLTWKHAVGLSSLASLCVAASLMTDRPVLVVGSVALAYLAGAFPQTWIPPLFSFAYSAYCSHVLGTRLKEMLHPRTLLPHSNFRTGCRLLGVTAGSGASTLCGQEALDRFCRPSASAASKDPLSDATLVVPVPIFGDNYAYLCFSRSTRAVVAVDPADAFVVLRTIANVSKMYETDYRLTDVLCTHKHWDHAGGNADLLQAARGELSTDASRFVDPNLRIYASKQDAAHGATHLIDVPVGGSTTIPVGRGNLFARVIPSPGHTKGSVIFLVGPRVGDLGSAALFTGDCIFCGGCGAMFEVRNVNDVLASYDAFHNDLLVCSNHEGKPLSPKSVFVYVGHEYSEMLIDELAKAAEAHSWPRECRDCIATEKRRIQQLRSLQREGETVMLPHCTVPSTLDVERKVNPLLTLRREVLVALRKKEARRTALFPVKSDMDKIIYLSSERIVSSPSP